MLPANGTGRSRPRSAARMSDTQERPVKRPLVIALGCLGLLAAVAALVLFRSIFVSLLVALVIAILLEPVIRFLQLRLKLGHGVSVVVTALVMLGVMGGVAYGGYAVIADQLRSLTEQAPAIEERLTAKVNEIVERFSWLGLDSATLDPSAYLQQLGTGALKMLAVGVEGLSFVLIVFMLALFIAANFKSYGRGCLTLFPPQKRGRIADLAAGSISVVRRWFFSQIIVVSISAVVTAVTLLLIGFDYWLVIAALTLVLDFIPFLGAILTGLIAAILTLGTEPEKLVWVLLAYLAIQQLESDVLLPLVMRGRIRLPEAHLLVFVLLMGSALGIVGIFLAPPLFAVLHHLYGEVYVPWIERRRGKPGEESSSTSERMKIDKK